MPVTAVLIVLLSIALMFLYAVPAVQVRLANYSESSTVSQAAAAAEALSEAEGEQELRRQLKLSAESTGGEIVVVDQQGRIVAREGSGGDFEPSEEMVRSASAGSRMSEKVDGTNVAVAPIVTEGAVTGGVVLASGEEIAAYQLFLQSGLEAAGIASIIGGGLMLLLATLLTRRVERLSLGARSIERGDLSHRIEPGSDDELGDLAKTFNAMTTRLESSFAQLEEKGATLDSILNNLDEGVLATNLGGDVMFANRAARSVLGLGGERLSGGLPNAWKDFDLPKAVSRCAEDREECGEAQVQEENTLLRIKLERMPAFDEHRGGVLVVIQDLSEGRRLEANQQRFLANAAHELKTPITTILAASELLLTGDADDPEMRQRFLDHIYSEANRMRRLSDTLLQLARTGWDLREPELEVLDLEEAARKVDERVKPLAESAGIELSFEGRGTRVRADAEWLEQALLVLLSNTIKHSSQGGQVWLRVSGANVAVQDEGVGISETDLPHVFERFYQGKGSSGGFGLGLPICKELVERMNGEISIDSREGVGTTVKIELPEVRDA